MISYTLYQKNTYSHYIYIDLEIPSVNVPQLRLQLPAWRPGRYELGNFAKNIKRVDVYNEKGESLEYRKLNKDLWEVECRGAKQLKVTYSYYANEMTAGSCFADHTQLYVNPVHCCMYVEGRTSEAHQIELKIPAEWKIASSLPKSGNTLSATDFDELADSPFIASPALQSLMYHAGGKAFHLHFNGICRPDRERLLKDFKAFTDCQINFWGDFPYEDYHFLFQVLPNKYYHGVEHKRCTVIALGPGYALNSGTTYEDLLGVSSHELFHVWNVKTIRPAEMLPYDFTRENYSSSGFVYEGFTTYYGDKMLLASGVFSIEQYFQTLEERLTRHFHNYGRFNLSVAASSTDTWLDGYVPGAPYRKTSIYDEGCLVAFMLDVMTLKATANNKSLRDVCRQLYERFGKKNIGYTAEDIRSLCAETSGKEMDGFFSEFVFAPADYKKPLEECLEYIGLQMDETPPASICEREFGFKVAESPSGVRISVVAPYSPAWKAGLFAGDDIIAVNDVMVKGNFNQWLEYFAGSANVVLTIASADIIRNVELGPGKKSLVFFATPTLKQKSEPSAFVRASFDAWKTL
jgi:predicted metalloprotease with PDZ domain